MKRSVILIVTLLVLSAILLTACGSNGDAGDNQAAAGQELFAKSILGTQAGCSACHSLEADTVIVGPSLAGIGSRSDSAAIRESILDPNAILVEGFPANTMPAVWSDELTDEQANQLVAYLLTLK
ncbi:MAG: cytochrome c [Anaerolineae bacterium]|nr:cytochrome c [Anaerolineae bacterium]